MGWYTVKVQVGGNQLHTTVVTVGTKREDIHLKKSKNGCKGRILIMHTKGEIYSDCKVLRLHCANRDSIMEEN